jgi:drug/metabolite transporter (DMT)-like permease
MRPADIARFVLLGALFGASFLFMRIAAPHFGAFCTAEVRVLLAGVLLAIGARAIAQPLRMRENWRKFLIAGAFNNAIPFALFAYAAIHIPAGYSAILNALLPIFAAFFSAAMLGERLTWRVFAGVIFALAGIALLVRLGPVEVTTEVLVSALACALATLCYGFAGPYTKKNLTGLPPVAGAANTMLAAAAVLLPAAALSVPGAMPPLGAWLAVASLAFFCSALAFILYFQLIRSIGATQISAVTFLLPAFGIFWGWLFLGEKVTVPMLGGFVLVAIAAGLVLGIGPFSPRSAAGHPSADYSRRD